MKVFFDMDGVLADFDRGIREFCGREPNVQGVSGPAADDEMWDAVSRVDHFYYRLKPKAGAEELFRRVYEALGQDCEILSGIPKPHHNVPTAGGDKIRWMHEYFSPDVKVNIVYREQKPDYCRGKDCILIDDYVQNIREWEAGGGTGILFTDAETVLRELEAQGVIPAESGKK